MDTKAFPHEHYLLYDDYKNQEACCDKCNEQIDGWAFTCEGCKFWLHKLCGPPPLKISHPIHMYLFLQIHDKNFICDRCFNLSRGYAFCNKNRTSMLDVTCVFSANDQTHKEKSERSKDIGKNIHHFSHGHSFTFFNYRKVRKYEYCCNWCEKPLSGMSYGCINCSNQFFLHQFCLYKIPNRILEHPFHPLHPLYISFNNDLDSICRACNNKFLDENRYSCHKCNFHLHVLCGKLKPTLRHECHLKHNLTYMVTTSQGATFQCNKCNSYYEER